MAGHLPGGSAPRSRWSLSRADALGIALGTGLGVMAAGPLVWLVSEARRMGQPELTAAAAYTIFALAAMFVGGSLIGGYVAAVLAQELTSRRRRRGPGVVHLPRLLLGCLLAGLSGPVIPALALGLAGGGWLSVAGYYIVAGGFVGWQSAVIAFVFLYTLRALEARRHERLSE